MAMKSNLKNFISAFAVAVFFFIAFGSVDDKKDSSSSNATAEDQDRSSNKSSSGEELPSTKTCTADVGILKMNENGFSIGEKTERTALLKLLKNAECDVIEITYEWAGDTHEDMPKKIVYDRNSATLKDIYTDTNVIEAFTGVDDESLLEFLENDENSFHALSKYTEIDYDFNNREMKVQAIGEKPHQSEWDSSVPSVKDYIKKNSKDPSSIQFIEWSKVSALGEYWVVRCKFSGTNSYGAVVTQNMWFYIQNGRVIRTKPIV